MRSMTGFGQAAGETARYRMAVRVRSVNHRFLDLALRLADDQRELEGRLRELLVAHLARGRVEVTVDLQQLGERQAVVELERSVLRSLHDSCQDLVREELLSAELRLGDLLRVPELVRVRWQPAAWSEEDSERLLEVTGVALDQLLAAREREGAQLAAVLEQRLDQLVALGRRLESRRAPLQDQLAATLRERVEALLGGVEVAEERLLQELAILVDRSDVTEELDRLGAHLESFRAVVRQDGPAGKQLDFLAQEIFRELNTVGSKCRDAEMIGWVVEAKLACEQLREQVQNVE